MSVDWDFTLLESLIEDRGDKVIHELGVACSNCNQNASVYGHFIQKDGSSLAAQTINCTHCQGDGFLYRNAREITGLVTAVNAGPNRKLITDGYAVPGDAVFSPSFNVGLISDFDRITMLNAVPISEGQIIIRNVANMGDNQLLKFNLAPTEDRLWYLPEMALHCEDQNGVVYSQGIDFVLADKVIRWIGSKPKNGTAYTLKYTAFLEFIAYSSPFNRFDRNRTLAQKVLLKKKHVLIQKGSLADTPAKRAEEEFVFTSK